MTNSQATMADVVAAFKERGFNYVKRKPDFVMLEGPLATEHSTHECFIFINQDFSSPPAIVLKQIPSELRPIAPHIDPDGGICYMARSTVTLNIFDPVGQMLSCLERARVVLGQILSGQANSDLAGEFFAYWGSGHFPCYYDLATDDLSKATCLANWDKRGNREPVLFVTDDEARTRYKGAALGYQLFSMKIPVARVSTKIHPKPSLVRWPLANIEMFLEWQGALDKAASDEAKSKLFKMYKNGVTSGILIVESPVFSYGLLAFFDGETSRSLGYVAGEKFIEKSIVPLVGYRLDERYISQRNIPNMKTLTGKRIAIVGCGTIGGYLADMLAKAGAGTGGGQLSLIDPDNLHTQNLGRHVLGFKYLAQNKAQSLAHYIAVNLPDTSVKAMGVMVKEMNLTEADLIIDATAEGAVASYLAKKYKKKATLTVWIEGPGVAVGGFLRAGEGHACSHCLATHNRNGKYRTTVELIQPKFEGQGCEQDYVPFPATVSIKAACLGAEMVMDWVAGKVQPTLRTSVLSSDFTSASALATPEPIEGCPACTT